MTSFCAQCGNQIRSGGKFCQSCGAPNAQASQPEYQNTPSNNPATPAQSGQPQGAGYQSAYAAGYQSSFPPQEGAQGQPPYGTPAPSSNKTLKVILITLAVLVILIGGSVAVVTYMIRRAVTNIVNVEEGRDGQPKVDINVPGGGKISVNSRVTEEQLGVAIYPGATPDGDGGTLTASSSIPGQSGSFSAAAFTTDDNIDEVVKFYREKLGEKVQMVDSSNEGKRNVLFTLPTEKGFRMIAVSEENEGKVKLVITTAGS